VQGVQEFPERWGDESEPEHEEQLLPGAVLNPHDIQPTAVGVDDAPEHPTELGESLLGHQLPEDELQEFGILNLEEETSAK
jgi:hypothetical protein